MKATVAFSGGIDSTAAIYQAIEDGATEIHAVTMKYGSLHQDREILAAHRVAEYVATSAHILNIVFLHSVVDLPHVFHRGGSALMGDVPMPSDDYPTEGPSKTYVPFRNSNILSVCTSLALRHGHDAVYAAMHGTDALGWAYPDCTPEFLGAMANAIYVGTYHKVRLVTPFMWMTKSQVIAHARGLSGPVPLWLTWSCYEGRDRHCGVCPTCRERIKAFKEAGFKDPVEYEIVVNWQEVPTWPGVT